jgi:hypothetical protein
MELALSVLARVNQTLIPPELFAEALELLFVHMSFGERSVFDDCVLCLIDFLKAKGFSGKRHADLVVAILFRASALAHLVQCSSLKCWISAGGEERGATPLHAEMILRAAAEEALVEDPVGDAAATFDVSSFMRRLLLVVQPEGRA